MSLEIKTRSTFYQRQMSDEVKYNVKKKAEELGISGWLLVEMILENAFGIANQNTIDVNEFLAGNHSKSRTGKPYKSKKR